MDFLLEVLSDALGALFGLPGLAETPWSSRSEFSIADPAFFEVSRMEFDTAGLAIELSGQIGAEALRTEGYGQFDRVTHAMMNEFDESQLIIRWLPGLILHTPSHITPASPRKFCWRLFWYKIR